MTFEERYTFEKIGIEAYHNGYSCPGAVIVALALAHQAVTSEQYLCIERGYRAAEFVAMTLMEAA